MESATNSAKKVQQLNNILYKKRNPENKSRFPLVVVVTALALLGLDLFLKYQSAIPKLP